MSQREIIQAIEPDEESVQPTFCSVAAAIKVRLTAPRIYPLCATSLAMPGRLPRGHRNRQDVERYKRPSALCPAAQCNLSRSALWADWLDVDFPLAIRDCLRSPSPRISSAVASSCSSTCNRIPLDKIWDVAQSDIDKLCHGFGEPNRNGRSYPSKASLCD